MCTKIAINFGFGLKGLATVPLFKLVQGIISVEGMAEQLAKLLVDECTFCYILQVL